MAVAKDGRVFALKQNWELSIVVDSHTKAKRYRLNGKSQETDASECLLFFDYSSATASPSDDHLFLLCGNSVRKVYKNE